MTKPVVQIWNARIEPTVSYNGDDNGRCLMGRVGEYPDDHGRGSSLSGQFVQTSNIVEMNLDESTVETRNTMYHVMSWAVAPEQE